MDRYIPSDVTTAIEQLMGLIVFVGLLIGAGVVIFSKFRQSVEASIKESRDEWEQVAKSKDARLAEMEDLYKSLEKELDDQKQRIGKVEGEKAQIQEMYVSSERIKHDLVKSNDNLQKENNRLNEENRKLYERHAEAMIEIRELKGMVAHLEQRLQDFIQSERAKK